MGLLLVAEDQDAPLLPSSPAVPPVKPIGSPISFLRAIAETMMEAHDRFYVKQANFARTIAIPTKGVGTTEFNISPDRARELFQSGKDAASAFLDTWNFDEYKAKFRQGTPLTRQQTVVGNAPTP